MRISHFTRAFVLATLAGIVACSSYGYGTLPNDPPQITGPVVEATPALAFNPAAITVHAGDTVSFAFGTVPHNVFFDTQAGAPANIDGRNTNVVITRTFTTPGTYRYECHVHPGMTGIVTVTGQTGNRFVGRSVNGAQLPALVDQFGDGDSAVSVFAVADTLYIDGNGGYRQAALLETYERGTRVGTFRYFDRGHYTIDGAKLHGTSDYLESGTLEATLGNDVQLHVTQVLVTGGSSATYVLAPVPL